MESPQITYNSGNAIMRGTTRNEVDVPNKTRVVYVVAVLRVLAMVSTLVAAIVVGLDTQNKVVQVQVSPTLPPLNVTVHAKWHYLSAIVFFVVANSIACGYAAISLILSLSSKKGLSLLIVTLDLVVTTLLFSSIGATGSVGLLAYKGNSHLQWDKVCNVFGRFCDKLMAGFVVSFFGSLVFLLLVFLSLLRKK